MGQSRNQVNRMSSHKSGSNMESSCTYQTKNSEGSSSRPLHVHFKNIEEEKENHHHKIGNKSQKIEVPETLNH